MTMTYLEACMQIASSKPAGWNTSHTSPKEFESDVERAKRMSDPNTWPEMVKAKAVEEIVRRIFSDSGDDVCWIEGVHELAKLFGIPCNPHTLPMAKMMDNCQRFITCCKTNQPYEKDAETLEMEDKVKATTPIDPTKGTSHLYGHVVVQWFGGMLSVFPVRTSEDTYRLGQGECWDFGVIPPPPSAQITNPGPQKGPKSVHAVEAEVKRFRIHYTDEQSGLSRSGSYVVEALDRNAAILSTKDSGPGFYINQVTEEPST